MQMAHEQLVSSSQGLREQGRACPTELMRTLMLLHSYILVKTLVRMGDHQVRTVPILLCITVFDCIWHHQPTCKKYGLPLQWLYLWTWMLWLGQLGQSRQDLCS